jgi:hypothetical protein
MDNNTIDKILKPLWDMKFNGTYLSTDEYVPHLSDIRNKDVSLGWINNKTFTFFYSSEFDNLHDYFNLTYNQFKQSMRRYINKKFNINLTSVC